MALDQPSRRFWYDVMGIKKTWTCYQSNFGFIKNRKKLMVFKFFFKKVQNKEELQYILCIHYEGEVIKQIMIESFLKTLVTSLHFHYCAKHAFHCIFVILANLSAICYQ